LQTFNFISRFLLTWLIIFSALSSVKAQKAVLTGILKDSLNIPLPDINVLSGKTGTITDAAGFFILPVNPGKVSVTFQGLGVETSTASFSPAPGETLQVNIVLRRTILKPVVFQDRKRDSLSELGIVLIRPEISRTMPVPGDALTNLIRAAGIGVSVNSELGSGYNVRGGNFDENLTYVNGVEVYRPFLARSGQQEGLSFVNPDMVENLAFSAGGFEARFGDKMASVLDVTYKKPQFFEANAMASLLGGQVYVGTPLFNRRLKVSNGFRYKSNNYLLSGLDTRGDYQPVFMDFQSYWAYDPSEKFEVSLLVNYSDNNFRLIPQNRSTTFGHVQEAKQLNIFFSGQEITRFQVATGILAFDFKPGGLNSRTGHRLSASVYQTLETENFDIIGQYFLGEIESDFGSDNFGEVKNTIGVGTFQNHARNQLFAQVAGADYQGRLMAADKEGKTKYSARWGLNYRYESLQDRLSEWNLLDSSGYLIPYQGPANQNPIELEDVRNNFFELTSNRFQGFFQNTFEFEKDTNRLFLTFGVRAHYWDLNQQLLISPRAQLAYRPHWTKDFQFRLSGGIYYQAPFYRELRDLDGDLNTDVRAQRSWHLVAGMDHEFRWWNRPFKLITEAYYKGYSDLNPYKIDNVRIRYYARNNAVGYAAGADMKLNGEFIPGLESWLTLSVMQTEEDLLDDSFINNQGELVFPGFIPRPTDQRVMLGLYFQDNIPKWERCRVHLNLLFGSQLPFGPPNTERFTDTLRAPFYRRVDIGFSLVLLETKERRKNPAKWKHVRSMWTSFEIFNLLDVNNTISYLWVRDVNSRRYAVPNYLTPRLFNLKFVIDFN
jgi:hypothetical protein